MKKNNSLGKSLHEKGSNGIGTEARKTQTKETSTWVTEVLYVLSDTVTNAIFRRIVESGGCLKEDLITMDAVIEESESVLTALKDGGFIEIDGEAIVATEKGRKALACIEEMENI